MLLRNVVRSVLLRSFALKFTFLTTLQIETIQKERAEERNLEEIQRIHEANGGKVTTTRGLAWMYSGPSDGGIGGGGGMGVSEEMEGYLLGKRRIGVDSVFKKKGEEAEQVAKADSEQAFGKAGSARDFANKVRDDPLLQIRKKEQSSYEALMNDPAARKRLRKAAEEGDENSTEKRDRRRRHRDDDRDGHRRRHRHSDDEKDRKRRKHRSPDDPEERSRNQRSHRRHRQRSYSPARSPSPYRRRDSYRSRHHRDRHYQSPSDSSSRSRSPPRRRYEDEASRFTRRSPSPHRRRHSPGRTRSKPEPYVSDADREAERAAKLAAMQSDAHAMDAQRKERLETLKAQDEADRERDDKVRSDSGRFVSGVRKQTAAMDLGDNLRRRGIAAGGE